MKQKIADVTNIPLEWQVVTVGPCLDEGAEVLDSIGRGSSGITNEESELTVRDLRLSARARPPRRDPQQLTELSACANTPDSNGAVLKAKSLSQRLRGCWPGK